MTEDCKVILQLSNEVQVLLDDQGVDLYRELQQEIPTLRVIMSGDPEAPSGARDIVPILYASAAVIGALAPIIKSILDRITPPNRANEYVVEEIETRHPDGTVVIQRKGVRSKKEERPWIVQQSSSDPSSNDALLPPPNEAKDK
ncbi:hypothetical protein [Dictyobacter formicarum]|uniref:Hydantoinase B/oxoprolinase domain-containing protein n=1 Tax=Dictyobacter formicarum TaxID=2778368 RepID=A0ABQ3VQD3_9CHLR|nr:hypothetical protein [Dictyobacter formicarum]GHO88020.1 hypothetical protein KSZ_60260 [Dictyobacter formicarum]